MLAPNTCSQDTDVGGTGFEADPALWQLVPWGAHFLPLHKRLYSCGCAAAPLPPRAQPSASSSHLTSGSSEHASVHSLIFHLQHSPGGIFSFFLSKCCISLLIKSKSDQALGRHLTLLKRRGVSQLRSPRGPRRSLQPVQSRKHTESSLCGCHRPSWKRHFCRGMSPEAPHSCSSQHLPAESLGPLGAPQSG